MPGISGGPGMGAALGVQQGQGHPRCSHRTRTRLRGGTSALSQRCYRYRTAEGPRSHPDLSPLAGLLPLRVLPSSETPSSETPSSGTAAERDGDAAPCGATGKGLWATPEIEPHPRGRAQLLAPDPLPRTGRGTRSPSVADPGTGTGTGGRSGTGASPPQDRGQERHRRVPPAERSGEKLPGGAQGGSLGAPRHSRDPRCSFPGSSRSPPRRDPRTSPAVGGPLRPPRCPVLT